MKEFKIDMVGKKFGRLTVLSFSEVRLEPKHNPVNKKEYWNCLCECGNTKVVLINKLKSGNTKSCGCLRYEAIIDSRTTHDMSTTRQYKTWSSMKSRTRNVNASFYEIYGGRGITCDESWDTFEGFWKDMSEGYSETMTLDRIDNNLGYSKENCRWVTPREQVLNLRKKVTNTSGVTGVCYDKKHKRWLAAWNDIDKKRKFKAFSIGVYGEELAFFMACEYREQQINFLRLLGLNYSENHGK